MTNQQEKVKVCQTCRYWARLTDASEIEGHGEWAGNCSSPKFVYDEKVPVDGLEYWDYESYSAEFRTGENFGCIHHQSKG